MKRLASLFIMAAFAAGAWSQNQVTLRQQNFPTALPMVEDNVEWQRDIYRELDLHDDRNAGLYCPVEPTKYQQGLFMKLFQVAVARMIPVYKYNIDGNEVFNDATRVDIADILTNHHIYFEENNGMITVEPSDIPASEVLSYYIKEGVYYDLSNSSFRVRVLAICPVITEDDEFTDGPTKYPLFWVEYKDLEPYIKDIMIVPDYRNRSMRMNMTDYFTLNKYHGDIYKVANAFGFTLRQQCETDSALKAEQQRIEREIRGVRHTTYNTYYNPVKATEKRSDTPDRKQKRRSRRLQEANISNESKNNK